MSDQAIIPARLKLALVLGYAGAAVVLIAALVFAVQPLSFLWLSVRHLPGFDISVPAGALSDEAVAYTVGTFTLRTAPAPAAIIVRWDPQRTDDDQLTARFTESARSQGGHVERSQVALADGQRASLWHLSLAAELWVTDVPCGGRQIRITTSSAVRGGARLHRRIVASVRCHPDPSREAALGDVPVVIPLPPGYKRVPAPVGDLQLVSDRKLVWARMVAGHLGPATGAQALEQAGALGPHVHVGAQDGDQFSFQNEAPDDRQFGWIATLNCRDLGASVWLIAMSRISRDDAKEGREILRQTRCRAVEEPPQPWPK
jgi:hypothetical protein